MSTGPHRADPGRFRCPFEGCDAAFRKASHFERHRRIHTKEQEFQCEFCDRRFARADSMARHQRRRHSHAQDSTACPKSPNADMKPSSSAKPFSPSPPTPALSGRTEARLPPIGASEPVNPQAATLLGPPRPNLAANPHAVPSPFVANLDPALGSTTYSQTHSAPSTAPPIGTLLPGPAIEETDSVQAFLDDLFSSLVVPGAGPASHMLLDGAFVALPSGPTSTASGTGTTAASEAQGSFAQPSGPGSAQYPRKVGQVPPANKSEQEDMSGRSGPSSPPGQRQVGEPGDPSFAATAADDLDKSTRRAIAQVIKLPVKPRELSTTQLLWLCRRNLSGMIPLLAPRLFESPDTFAQTPILLVIALAFATLWHPSAASKRYGEELWYFSLRTTWVNAVCYLDPTSEQLMQVPLVNVVGQLFGLCTHRRDISARALLAWQTGCHLIRHLYGEGIVIQGQVGLGHTPIVEDEGKLVKHLRSLLARTLSEFDGPPASAQLHVSDSALSELKGEWDRWHKAELHIRTCLALGILDSQMVPYIRGAETMLQGLVAQVPEPAPEAAWAATSPEKWARALIETWDARTRSRGCQTPARLQMLDLMNELLSVAEAACRNLDDIHPTPALYDSDRRQSRMTRELRAAFSRAESMLHLCNREGLEALTLYSLLEGLNSAMVPYSGWIQDGGRQGRAEGSAQHNSKPFVWTRLQDSSWRPDLTAGLGPPHFSRQDVQRRFGASMALWLRLWQLRVFDNGSDMLSLRLRWHVIMLQLHVDQEALHNSIASSSGPSVQISTLAAVHAGAILALFLDVPKAAPIPPHVSHGVLLAFMTLLQIGREAKQVPPRGPEQPYFEILRIPSIDEDLEASQALAWPTQARSGSELRGSRGQVSFQHPGPSLSPLQPFALELCALQGLGLSQWKGALHSLSQTLDFPSLPWFLANEWSQLARDRMMELS